MRVVSNFGDGDSGAGEIHTQSHARNFEEARREESAKNFGALPRDVSPRSRRLSRTRVYFAGVAKIRDFL